MSKYHPPRAITEIFNPYNFDYEFIRGFRGLPGPPPVAYYGQMSNQTSQVVTIETAGVYVPMNVVGTFDTTAFNGTSAPTTATFGVKNTSAGTRLFLVIATADVQSVAQQVVGLKIGKNGIPDDRTECRAPTGNVQSFAKTMTQWMISLDHNEEVSMFVSDITSNNNLTIQRAKIVATSIYQS